MKKLAALLTCLVVLVLIGGSASAGSSGTNLPGGAALTVSIDSPETSNEFLIAEGSDTRDVTISGTASVGQGLPNATMVYVLDVSGSTSSGGGTGCSPILQCEQNFLNNLNTAVVSTGSVANVGIVVFADSAAAADMSGDASDQLLVAPGADSNVSTVVNSAFATTVSGGTGGVTQFTLRQVGEFTNFGAALQSALTVLGASTDDVKRVVFMSDGLSNVGDINVFNAAVAQLDALGVQVDSIAVGAGSSCAGGDTGTLAAMAVGGGSCTEVADPGTLPNIIPGLVEPWLDGLTLEVDGAPVASTFTTSQPLPVKGAASVDYETTAPGLAPGDHTLCVTAAGHDTIGTATVTQCETVHLYKLTLAPAAATNELGSPPQTHTVNATLLGPTTGLAPVEDRTVDFSILSGPNAGTTGSALTDATGVAPFEYTAASGPAGLGTDVIEACITLSDPLGETGCVQATKIWQDTTPPVASCVPTVNPGGKQIPVAPGKGGKGQNQDGFYQLLAIDAVWPAEGIQVYVTDTGSGTVFGPFPVGTNIKYTQAPGAMPFMEPMDGAVAWHIVGTGDARLTAVDGSGNISTGVMCLVPPPPQ